VLSRSTNPDLKSILRTHHIRRTSHMDAKHHILITQTSASQEFLVAMLICIGQAFESGTVGNIPAKAELGSGFS
jgi:hypothetical protein